MQHLPNKTGGNISIDTRVLGTIQLNQIKVELNPFEEFGKMDLVQCLAPIETSYWNVDRQSVQSASNLLCLYDQIIWETGL